MIINKNSWHYKFWSWTYTNRWFDEYPPTQTNLCSYVQRMLWTPLYLLILTVFFLAVALTLVGGTVFLEYKAWSTHPYVSLGIHIGLPLLIAICVGYAFLRNNNNATLLMVSEYISAKKKGMCPLIEFNNNEQ